MRRRVSGLCSGLDAAKCVVGGSGRNEVEVEEMFWVKAKQQAGQGKIEGRTF